MTLRKNKWELYHNSKYIIYPREINPFTNSEINNTIVIVNKLRLFVNANNKYEIVIKNTAIEVL